MGMLDDMAKSFVFIDPRDSELTRLLEDFAKKVVIVEEGVNAIDHTMTDIRKFFYNMFIMKTLYDPDKDTTAYDKFLMNVGQVQPDLNHMARMMPVMEQRCVDAMQSMNKAWNPEPFVPKKEEEDKEDGTAL